MALPFVPEMRCLIDWVLSKTSLDFSANFMLFYYHVDMIKGHGNDYYTTKPLGEEVTCFEKSTSGGLILWVLLTLLVGPFLMFSQLSPLIQDNPVSHGEIVLSI
jgi:hypothetical protein